MNSKISRVESEKKEKSQTRKILQQSPLSMTTIKG